MPRPETQNRPPMHETDNRRPFSPETSRMLIAAIVPSIIHPGNNLKPEHKQEFAAKVTTIKQENLPVKEIAALSGENRRQNSATYEDWQAGVKEWFDNKKVADKQQIQQTFSSLGIQVEEVMEHEQINTFFDNYLSMSGSEEDYQRRYTSFVQKVVGEFVHEGTLDQQALNQRMTLLRPLLGSFGETDIVTLVDAHIQAAGFVAQKEEVKLQQAPEVLAAMDLPMATDDSIYGFRKLAEKREVRSETPPPPEDDDDTELTPELAASDPEKFKETLLARLGDLTQHTKKVWKIAEEKGWVTKDTLTIHADTWDSHSDDQTGIQLGTKMLPDNIPIPIIGAEQMSYEEQIAFRLTHELVHKIDPAVFVDPQMEAILKYAKRVRTNNPDNGLTVLAHNEHYKQKGPELQAREDLVELATMYLYSKQYFTEYLNLLSEEGYADMRQSLHLVELSTDNAQAILTIFDKVLGEKFLEIPLEEPDETKQPDEDTEKQRKREVMQRFLTPDIARSDPEVFKAMLIENLDLYSKFGKEAIAYALQKGIVKFEDLHINPDTWNSSSDSSTGIVLGAADFPVEQSENIVFENRRFSYQEQVAMRLLHELCHKLNYTTFKHDSAFSVLMEKTFVSRAQTGEGFSALGSQFFYENQGPEVQGRDDLVEMVTMYLTDPEYLARFMNFLISEDPTNEATRQALKLRKIELETAKNIFSTIDQAVTKGLTGQLEPAQPVAA